MENLKSVKAANAQNVEKNMNSKSPTSLSDFEAAIEMSGFGRFNIILLIVALMAAMGSVFETSTVSYILPNAECDLQLTLLDKGILNAITYAGMITSAIAWGFLADVKGRKSLLVMGLLIGGVCDIGAAASQNRVQLMVFKYLGGFIMCGPFAVLMSYLSEIHGKRYRSRIMMITGIMFATSSVTLPSLALLILPIGWSFHFGSIIFHPWQIFLGISAIPTLVGGFSMIFFPESPKFLMSQGRNSEALEVFKKIYSFNKRMPKDTFPIKELICEIPENTIHSKLNSIPEEGNFNQEGKEKFNIIESGIRQIRPLFTKPYLGLSLLVYLINTLALLGQNTTRLWLPQLFASINEFEQISNETTKMCNVLEFSVNKTVMMLDDNHICKVIITPSTYMNNIIVGATNFVGYIIVGIIVNLIGTKRIMQFALFFAGMCGICLFWSKSSVTVLALSAMFTTCGSITSTSIINSSVNLFPTSLRTMILSVAMMLGRSGSLIGNVIFPLFIEMGCLPPFLLISTVMFLAFLLSIFLPNSGKEPLK